ncbi:MAG: hypothetical protein JJT78_09875 [Leptospira sp.]|nr:hypothetical protein [Leptospira sp.]
MIYSIPVYLSASPSPYSYDILLDQAVTKMKAFDYGRALDRLALAKEKVKSPDYRYHYILGETYFRMGKHTESMKAFDNSLQLEPGQTDLLLKVAEFHESDRRPHLALGYLQKYLRFIPDDKTITYRAGILARQSGKNELANTLFQNLESDPTYRMEKDAIIELIRKDIQSKKWKEAIEKSQKFILYFPREEIIHEYLILAMRGNLSSGQATQFAIDKAGTSTEKELEKAIIDSASVFFESANFAVRYGIFLQEKERMLEALAAFRRAFSIALVQNQDLKNQAEIFFLIRQTYSFLDREHDARALSQLDTLIQNNQADNEENVNQASTTYPKNREILEYAVNYFRRNGNLTKQKEFETKLRNRDREFEEKELIYVIGPFSREKLD